MTTTLALASPRAAFGTAPADRASPKPHFRPSVDALVTIAVMAWFIAALATMIGEFRGTPPAPVAQSAATRTVTTALPQAPKSPWLSAHARITLI